MFVYLLTFLLLLFAANLCLLVRGIELTQANLAVAKPGDVFTFDTELNYTFSTSTHGTKDDPISIRGIGENAIINGFNATLPLIYTVCMQVRHDYYILENFIVKECDKGVQAYNASHGIIRNVIAENITTTFFQIRFHSSYWLVDSCIARYNRNYGSLENVGKYGEGFYIGSAYNNRCNNGQKGEMDETHHITILNCLTIDTINDGYDVKEGSTMIKYVNSVASWTGPSPGDETLGINGFYIRADKVSVVNNQQRYVYVKTSMLSFLLHFLHDTHDTHDTHYITHYTHYIGPAYWLHS